MPSTKRRPQPLSIVSGSREGSYETTSETTAFHESFWTDERGRVTSGAYDPYALGYTDRASVPVIDKNERVAGGGARDLDAEGLVATARLKRGWVPTPLRATFWIPYVATMLLVAIGLEIALVFSEKNNGFPVVGELTAQTGVMHYVYTAIPSAVGAVAVGLWAWTDIEIKKMQPYVDLIRGDSPSSKSLLLDYTRINNYFVWFSALKNKHYLVSLSTCLVILLAAFSPLASALFAVKNTYWTAPPVTVFNRQLIGLNPALGPDANTSARDLLSGAIVAAAGYAGAQAGYPYIPAPPFTLNGFTIGEFEIPTSFGSNGTVFANTTALLTDAGCEAPSSPVAMNQLPNSTWVNTATYRDCTFEWSVNNTAPFLYGHNILDSASQCAFSVEGGTAFAPVAFWFFTYVPTPMSNVAFCNSTLALYDIEVQYDLASGSITSLDIHSTFSNASNFSSFSGNVTALGGRALNGWALPDVVGGGAVDSTVANNLAAAQAQVPAAIFQSAVGFNNSLDVLTDIFHDDTFVTKANEVCTTFLALVARSFYFVNVDANMDVVLGSFRLRLFLSPVATHLLSGALIILSISAIWLHLKHAGERRDLVLTHQPGTIASAVAIGAQTRLGTLLAEPRHMNDNDLEYRLKEMKFTMNPVTLKIVSEGEAEYEALQRERERQNRERASMRSTPSRRQSVVGSIRSAFSASPRSARSFRSAQEAVLMTPPPMNSPISSPSPLRSAAGSAPPSGARPGLHVRNMTV